jgi:hypothetical protein
MFKVRIVGEKQLHAFDTRDEAFDWARENVSKGKMFALLSFNRRGDLETLDRFTFTGRRMVIENITR